MLVHNCVSRRFGGWGDIVRAVRQGGVHHISLIPPVHPTVIIPVVHVSRCARDVVGCSRQFGVQTLYNRAVRRLNMSDGTGSL